MIITLFGKEYVLEKDLMCRPPRDVHTNDYRYRKDMLIISGHITDNTASLEIDVYHSNGSRTQLAKSGIWFTKERAQAMLEIILCDISKVIKEIEE